MSDCNCRQNAPTTESIVPDFSVHGFEAKSSELALDLKDVYAAQFSACVAATYASGQLCFTFPIIGKLCFAISLPVPPGASLKVCGQTCGIIPRGLKITVYANDRPIWSGVVWGSC